MDNFKNIDIIITRWLPVPQYSSIGIEKINNFNFLTKNWRGFVTPLREPNTFSAVFKKKSGSDATRYREL